MYARVRDPSLVAASLTPPRAEARAAWQAAPRATSPRGKMYVERHIVIAVLENRVHACRHMRVLAAASPKFH